MLRINTLKFAAILVTLAGTPILAHHAFSSEYDASKPVTLSGSVSKVEWTSPHAFVYMNVKTEGGKTEEWKFEMASPDYLTQHGVKEDTFKKGENLTVKAYGATNNAHMGSARTVTANGKSMPVADAKEDGGPAK